jgi:hypothetical protein
MIIDNGILNEMQPEVSTLENGTPIVSYCGIANDGQKVCVSDYPILVRMQRPVFVFLDGRNIGQGPISFE